MTTYTKNKKKTGVYIQIKKFTLYIKKWPKIKKFKSRVRSFKIDIENKKLGINYKKDVNKIRNTKIFYKSKKR